MFPPGAIPQPAHLCRRRIRDVVPIQVGRRPENAALIEPGIEFAAKEFGDSVVAEAEEYRAEASRLEAADRSRNASSIVMLEARASALDKCIADAETLARSEKDRF